MNIIGRVIDNNTLRILHEGKEKTFKVEMTVVTDSFFEETMVNDFIYNTIREKGGNLKTVNIYVTETPIDESVVDEDKMGLTSRDSGGYNVKAVKPEIGTDAEIAAWDKEWEEWWKENKDAETYIKEYEKRKDAKKKEFVANSFLSFDEWMKLSYSHLNPRPIKESVVNEDEEAQEAAAIKLCDDVKQALKNADEATINKIWDEYVVPEDPEHWKDHKPTEKSEVIEIIDSMIREYDYDILTVRKMADKLGIE